MTNILLHNISIILCNMKSKMAEIERYDDHILWAEGPFSSYAQLHSIDNIETYLAQKWYLMASQLWGNK